MSIGSMKAILSLSKTPDVSDIAPFWDVDTLNGRAVHRSSGFVLRFTIHEYDPQALEVDIVSHGDFTDADEEQLASLMKAGTQVYIRHYFNEQ